MAMQTAIAQERFHYYSGFAGTLFTILPIVAIRTKNAAALGPLLPVGFAWAFQYDVAYGNLMLRAQKDASRMIKEEPERFFMPSGNGMVTQEDYNRIIGLPKDYAPKK